MPLWNPYQATGVPLAANFQSGVFSPMQWPFFLSTSRWWWDFLLVARLLLAGAFTYLFLRKIGLEGPPAWLGGLAYMLTGYLIDYVNMNHLAVPLLLPAGFYFLESWRRHSRARDFVGAAGALALIVLVGMPEAALLSWTFLACFAAFQLVLHRQVLSVWIQVASIFLLGALSSAILLIPGLEYLSLCHSKHFVLPWGLQSFSLETAVGYLIPYFFGPPGALAWNPIYDKGFHVPSAVGVTAVILAFLGLLVSRSRLRWFFGLYAGLALLKIFGTPVVNLLGALPLFNLVIFTKYLQPSIAFSVAVLVALGFNEVRSRRFIGPHMAALALLIVSVCVGFTLLYARDIYSIPQPQVRFWIAVCIIFAIGIGLTGATLGFLHARGFRWTPSAIYALAAVEVMLLAVRIHPPRRPEGPEETSVVRQVRGVLTDDFRIFGDYPFFPNTGTGLRVADLRVLDPILPKNLAGSLEDLAYLPLHSRFSFREFDDYGHPALDLLGVRYVVSTHDIRNLLLRQQPTAPSERLSTERWAGHDLQFLSLRSPSTYPFYLPADDAELTVVVRLRTASGTLRLTRDSEVVLETRLDPGLPQSLGPYGHAELGPARSLIELSVETEGDVEAAVISAKDMDDLHLISRNRHSGPFHLFERPSALPVAFLVHPDQVPEESLSLDHVTRKTIPKADVGTVEIRKRTADQLRLGVTTPSPATLLISQTHYPGWKAVVNGQPVELRQAASFLTALGVPSGTSEVVLVYSPLSVYVGTAVTLAGLLLTVAAAVRTRSRRVER